MDYSFTCAYPWVFYIFGIFVALIAWYRFTFYKPVLYRFSLGSALAKHQFVPKIKFKSILFIVRLIILFLIVCIIMRPQLIDMHSQIQVKGVDIMLVLDVSGSMQCFDDIRDRRSRISVAKEEAIRFIQKREYDPIGIVIFANDVISRCPLTLDKNILKEIVQSLDIGIINHDGTLLSLGIVMAANRLKNSQAASKVMIVLTDGAPSPNDIDVEQAISIAKQVGVKIYTIGVGNQQGGYYEHPLLGIVQAGIGLNRELLQSIAQETGGKFFEAKHPEDVKKVYATIDALEKTEYKTNIFSNYYELFQLLVLTALMLLFIELLLSSFVWLTL